jgi:hypothetical protein
MTPPAPKDTKSAKKPKKKKTQIEMSNLIRLEKAVYVELKRRLGYGDTFSGYIRHLLRMD